MNEPRATPFRRISGWFTRLWRRLRGGGSPFELGVSVAVGLFIGSLPLYGLHFPLCLLACWPFGLDVVAAYLAAQISNPWFAPFLVALEARIGGFILGRAPLGLQDVGAAQLGDLFERTLVGAPIVGFALAAIGFVLTFVVARRTRGQRPGALVLEPTLARYRQQSPGDRWYVDLKLRTDPVVPQLAALGSLGSVIDAGCGRGQLGLLLYDLGQANRLVGFDPDARKVGVATLAAGSDAAYEVSDLLRFSAAPASADSVLLIDVLHYLTPAEQQSALACTKIWLKIGGRLLVREVDARPGVRSAFTRLAERIGTAAGYNRATRPLGFRPLKELMSEMEALGFRCELGGDSAGTPFDNALIVATLGRGPD